MPPEKWITGLEATLAPVNEFLLIPWSVGRFLIAFPIPVDSLLFSC